MENTIVKLIGSGTHPKYIASWSTRCDMQNGFLPVKVLRKLGIKVRNSISVRHFMRSLGSNEI